jgi:hypothetical protein
MLSGPLIGIDLRILIWMVGWFASAYLTMMVLLLPSLGDELYLAGTTVAATSAIIVATMYMPWNQK